MHVLRRAAERGQAEHGWLSSRHTFSFSEYYDPEFMGFGPLRVINDDRVTAGAGFGKHPHRDMEIISYVLEGALEHKDSMGNGSVIRPGDVQVMRAGTGVTHSEFNSSKTDPVHFLQIWVVPEERGLPPNYAQRNYEADRKNKLCLVASRGGRDQSLDIAQDVDLFACELQAGVSLSHTLAPGRQVWIQVAEGELSVTEVSSGDTPEAQHQLGEGDGLALVGATGLNISTPARAHFLVFDMPGNQKEGEDR